MSSIPGDASARQYFRLAQDDIRAVLMDYNPADEPSESAKDYMRRARLAGTDMNSFAAIGTVAFYSSKIYPKTLAVMSMRAI